MIRIFIVMNILIFTKLINWRKHYPPENNTNPSEVSDAIAVHEWFWNNESSHELQSAEDIVDGLKISNKRSANYLLNVQPNRDGLISGPYLKRLREIGDLVKEKEVLKD